MTELVANMGKQIICQDAAKCISVETNWQVEKMLDYQQSEINNGIVWMVSIIQLSAFINVSSLFMTFDPRISYGSKDGDNFGHTCWLVCMALLYLNLLFVLCLEPPICCRCFAISQKSPTRSKAILNNLKRIDFNNVA